MTTHETHDNTGPQPDPMSDGEPMGASDRPDTQEGAPMAVGGLIRGPGTWADPDPGGCEYIVPLRPRCKNHAEGCTHTPIRGLDVCPQHLSPGLRALREANDRLVEHKRTILDRLDVDPWRVPGDGLLEYDEVHDEWRVELYRVHRNPEAGRIIVRRYAGRRAAAALGDRSRFTSLNQYLVGGDEPGAPRVMIGPPGGDEPGWGPPASAAYWARWRRVADAYRKASPPAYDRGRHLHHWPVKVDRDDQVDAMRYAASAMEGQLAARRLAAQMGVGLERSRGRGDRGV